MGSNAILQSKSRIVKGIFCLKNDDVVSLGDAPRSASAGHTSTIGQLEGNYTDTRESRAKDKVIWS